MPPKKGRGRPTANKVTKPAPKTSASARRASDRVAVAVEKETERQALAEKSNNQKTKPGRGRGRKAVAPKEDADMQDASALATPPDTEEAAKPKGRGRPKRTVQESEKEVPDSTRKEPAWTQASRRGGRQAAQAAEVESTVEEVTEISETQAQEIDTDAMELDHDEPVDLPVSGSDGHLGKSRAPSSPQKSTNAGADGGDPALRRRLGDLTKKYESLEAKYRDLREIGIKDAERNFDKFKKQAEERASASKELIANLKAELTAQKELAREGQKVKKQLAASEATADSLQSQVTSMIGSLSESKSEIKSLNMKLTASRNAEAAAAAKVVPGSAMKGNMMRPTAQSEAIQQATKTSQMKIDLYGDLCGLIIRSIKREGDEDVYDCIQTGRDGRTLHFKLSICNDPSSANYEEAEFLYQPFLDESRDRDLIDVLPGYLVDEITFPRHQCNKFYVKVLEALHQREAE
ncbi:hypothetical protein GQ53DRAFT_643788 [Thozetella sp. PMI_491]|nr:hypothetical protein GQ53DRAFT_643788 [Thozetella sp. PMI_491]